MAKDFITELEKSYPISRQIGIQKEMTPTDMRDNCDTVEDFQTIADAGMDIRYHGLVTTETATGLTKVCKLVDGNFVWETLGVKGDTDEIYNKLDELKNDVSYNTKNISNLPII